LYLHIAHGLNISLHNFYEQYLTLGLDVDGWVINTMHK